MKGEKMLEKLVNICESLIPSGVAGHRKNHKSWVSEILVTIFSILAIGLAIFIIFPKVMIIKISLIIAITIFSLSSFAHFVFFDQDL